jgi:hypothetical protein
MTGAQTATLRSSPAGYLYLPQLACLGYLPMYFFAITWRSSDSRIRWCLWTTSLPLHTAFGNRWRDVLLPGMFESDSVLRVTGSMLAAQRTWPGLPPARGTPNVLLRTLLSAGNFQIRKEYTPSSPERHIGYAQRTSSA